VSITEANAINVLLRYVLNMRDSGRDVPTHEQALDAAALLADKAHKPLMAGLDSNRVRAAWPDLLLDNERPAVSFTREQIEAWAGGALTDGEVDEIDVAASNSSIPDAIADIAASIRRQRAS
jgi:hypothetical protein